MLVGCAAPVGLAVLAALVVPRRLGWPDLVALALAAAGFCFAGRPALVAPRRLGDLLTK